MGNQWGHGHATGKVEAMKEAAEAVQHLQNRDVYAMALIHKIMNSHPDKNLVNKAHKAIIESKTLHDIYLSGFWHGNQAGMFVEELPPMSKKSAIESIFQMAREKGWKGPIAKHA